MAVQPTFFMQENESGRRIIVHLWNGVNTAANHGLPANDVPLREETIPVSGIRLFFAGLPVRRAHAEPEGKSLSFQREGKRMRADVPTLNLHTMIVLELDRSKKR